MSATTFNRTKEVLSAADIEAVEAKFGFKFPADFKDHYLLYNGGNPDKNFFILHNDSIYGVQLFLSIKYGNHTIEEDIQQLKVDEAVLPEDLVPFAIDSSGNYFCFSKSEISFGVIYYWDSENYDDPDRAVTRLADSLSDFIAGLQDEPKE